jgi:FKBP-type peptidyl-prolyl cis-trans isomerase
LKQKVIQHQKPYILILLILIIAACSNTDGFKSTDSGLQYKFHSQNPENPKVKLYDVVKVQMNYRTEDSLLYEGGKQAIPFQIDPVYDGDLMEGIMLMHLEDSATFLIGASDFFLKMMGYEKVPDHAANVDDLYFDIKVVEIRPETEALKRQRLDMENRKKSEPQKIRDYVQKNDISVKPTSTGLYIITMKEGSGPEAKVGSKVKVHFTGKLLNGNVYDSSRKRGLPVSFKLGAGEVIAAWDEALVGMNQGTEIQLIVPSSLAYGDKQRAGVGPYSPLVFDIELIEVK